MFWALRVINAGKTNDLEKRKQSEKQKEKQIKLTVTRKDTKLNKSMTPPKYRKTGNRTNLIVLRSEIKSPTGMTPPGY